MKKKKYRQKVKIKPIRCKTNIRKEKLKEEREFLVVHLPPNLIMRRNYMQRAALEVEEEEGELNKGKVFLIL